MVDDEADGIDRIVLDGKRIDRDATDGKPASGFKHFPLAALDAPLPHHLRGGRRRVHRHRVLLQENFQPADVVAVLVGQ